MPHRLVRSVPVASESGVPCLAKSLYRNGDDRTLPWRETRRGSVGRYVANLGRVEEASGVGPVPDRDGGSPQSGEFLARSRIGRNPDTGAGGPDGGRLSDQGSLLHDPPTSRRPSTQDQWETAPRTGTRGLPTDPEETPKPRDGSVGRTEVLQSTGPRDTTTTTKRKPNCFVWGGRPLPDEDYA